MKHYLKAWRYFLIFFIMCGSFAYAEEPKPSTLLPKENTQVVYSCKSDISPYRTEYFWKDQKNTRVLVTQWSKSTENVDIRLNRMRREVGLVDEWSHIVNFPRHFITYFGYVEMYPISESLKKVTSLKPGVYEGKVKIKLANSSVIHEREMKVVIEAEKKEKTKFGQIPLVPIKIFIPKIFKNTPFKYQVDYSKTYRIHFNKKLSLIPGKSMGTEGYDCKLYGLQYLKVPAKPKEFKLEWPEKNTRMKYVCEGVYKKAEIKILENKDGQVKYSYIGPSNLRNVEISGEPWKLYYGVFNHRSENDGKIKKKIKLTFDQLPSSLVGDTHFRLGKAEVSANGKVTDNASLFLFSSPKIAVSTKKMGKLDLYPVYKASFSDGRHYITEYMYSPQLKAPVVFEIGIFRQTKSPWVRCELIWKGLSI
ncbi:MAG: hypothetical protein KDD61_04225 [Bdellovibrionales bacterium]|nr:hypothetical protein [Bdellovibrionales bacterium]